LQVIQGATDIG